MEESLEWGCGDGIGAETELPVVGWLLNVELVPGCGVVRGGGPRSEPRKKKLWRN